MALPKIYLVTGANRGIGKGFTGLLLQKPSVTVIAAVRNPSHISAKELTALPIAEGSKLILVPLDSTSETSAKDAVRILKNDHGIKYLDVVIANAGICTGGGTVRDTEVGNNIDYKRVANPSELRAPPTFCTS
ncbi:unnamed protein product [Alternaria alternata]